MKVLQLLAIVQLIVLSRAPMFDELVDVSMFVVLVLSIFGELEDVTVVNIMSDGAEFIVVVDVTLEPVTTETSTVDFVFKSSFGLEVSSSDELDSYFKTGRLR